MSAPAPLPPTNPVFVALDAIALGYGLYETYQASNNYINKTSNKKNLPSKIPDIPTSKTPTAPAALSPKAAQKASLGDYAVAIGTTLALATTQFGDNAQTAKKGNDEQADAKKNQTESLLSPVANSPFLTNQLFVKDSIDGIIHAINSSTIANVTMISTLNTILSAIGSSLTSLSATLIELADNYQEDLTNTGETPYINGDDYYKTLLDSGFDSAQIQTLRDSEKDYIELMRGQGASYPDIKKAVSAWRQQNVPQKAQQTIDDFVNGLYKGWRAETTKSLTKDGKTLTELIPNSSASPAPSVSLELPKLEAWAESQIGINNALTPEYIARELYARMLKNEFATTQREIRDLDGNVVANMKPMEVSAVKNATDAKLRTDMNNLTMSDSDLDLGFGDGFDISSIFEFTKKTDRLKEVLQGLS